MPLEPITRPFFKSPARVLSPSSLAIVGASERGRWPRQLFGLLKKAGYSGPIYAVNPRAKLFLGEPCYESLATTPSPASHALVIVPAEAVQEVLEVGASAGLQSATVYAGNIGEGNDPKVVGRGAALRDLVTRTGLTILGPNCMGCNALRERFLSYPNNELATLPPGPVALVSQSGGTLQFVAQSAADRGVRFSYLISSGSELDLDLADFIDHFIQDEHTRVIALFIEGIRRPQAFMEAAGRALAAGKPIIAIKTGRSQKSRDAALSHTGAIAGNYDVFSAMCEKYGIIHCSTLEEMVESMLAFQAGRLPRGGRVAWVTTSGGIVDLLHDYLEEAKELETPDFDLATEDKIRHLISEEVAFKNPLDAGMPAGEHVAAEICRTVIADPNVDMLAWATTLRSGNAARDEAIVRSVLAVNDKPVLGFSRMAFMHDRGSLRFQEAVGFPFLQGLQPTIRVLSALAFYGARAGTTPSPYNPVAESGVFNECDFDILLERNGLTAPKSELAKTPEEAIAAAKRVGWPVAIKIVSPDISHKTEVGGVTLNLSSPKEVKNACEVLARSIGLVAPSARLEGFLVQEMVSGVEIILGVRTDPLYGPVIMVGAGGIFAELIRDFSLRLLPIDANAARSMIGELRVNKLLSGFRGKPACDIEGLVQAICGLARVYSENRCNIADLEINPLIVLEGAHGVRAVDVRRITTGRHSP